MLKPLHLELDEMILDFLVSDYLTVAAIDYARQKHIPFVINAPVLLPGSS